MNYIDNNLKKIDQNKTIGIIICRQDKNVIKYCSDNRIIAREYILNWRKNYKFKSAAQYLTGHKGIAYSIKYCIYPVQTVGVGNKIACRILRT